ncbi:hypothetical protein R50073_23200 [Maricurvus nonylphenolicus]|uniref:hypothetical protein n=1 Tax=Maricurvus nonylphenolicus TaxID=1008307 RepID=UPI0036F24CEE
MNTKALIFTALLMTAGAANACDKPTAPTLPDPDNAVTAQMVKAKNEMKAFITAAETYLKCVENDTGKYNAMVDVMQKAADDFNGIVRKYKKRMSAA